MRGTSFQHGQMVAATSLRIRGDRRDLRWNAPRTHSWQSKAKKTSIVCGHIAIAGCLVAAQRRGVPPASVSPEKEILREPTADRSQSGRDKDLQTCGFRRTCRNPTTTHAADHSPDDNRWNDHRHRDLDDVQNQNQSTNSHQNARYLFPNTRLVVPLSSRQTCEPSAERTIPDRHAMQSKWNVSLERFQACDLRLAVWHCGINARKSSASEAPSCCHAGAISSAGIMGRLPLSHSSNID